MEMRQVFSEQHGASPAQIGIGIGIVVEGLAD
jgi:hypothetical protein